MKPSPLALKSAPNDEDLAFDRDHIWHPYTSLINPIPVFPVVSAKGVRLTLKDGRELIDGMASWWSVIHGYNNPRLNRALTEQVDKFSHVMFGGLTHSPAIELCKKLVAMTPKGLEKVFIADSGSIAVEVAIKMAMQYWQAIGRKKKNRLLTVRNGYHGDTLGTMAVCDPVTGMHGLFTGLLTKHLFAEAPACAFDQLCTEDDIENFRELIKANHESLAAVIMEPIVQGAGGMRFYSPEYLKKVRALCDKYDVLLILDEIATGFGRSGKLFACEHANIEPDILCLGKGITGGYISLAATLATEKVSDGICRDGVFMHGPTYMGNPLACAVANESLNIIAENHWKKQVSAIETGLKKGLEPCRPFECVADVRVLGAIGVVELKEPVNMREIQPRFVEKGVWVRPFGKLVYVMPPYVMEQEDLDFLTNAIVEIIQELEG